MTKYDFEKAGITLVKELDVNLPKLYIDPHQTEQVFLNLANNALDIIEEYYKS